MSALTTTERQARRRIRLDELARSIGYETWAKLETGALRGEIEFRKEYPSFDNMDEAFKYCIQSSNPVLVRIQGYNFKLYPSGRAHKV